MATTKPTARITLSFYEDEILDLAILEILNSITTKRNRGNKVKDILIEYFKYKCPDNFESIKNKLSEEIFKEEKNTLDKTNNKLSSKNTKEDNDKTDDLINLVEKNKDSWGNL